MQNTAPEIIVRIHRPELTPQERERRMADIAQAAARLIAETLRSKAAN